MITLDDLKVEVKDVPDSVTDIAHTMVHASIVLHTTMRIDGRESHKFDVVKEAERQCKLDIIRKLYGELIPEIMELRGDVMRSCHFSHGSIDNINRIENRFAKILNMLEGREQ